ncbi:GNAT family N-acetyltransferase [Enterococcus alishanensis]|nr:GNAT family N-acetyltransferase [Enterococcus alishanensis]
MNYLKRIAVSSDYSNILKLINNGKEQMKSAGITQWNDSYPSKEIIWQDIIKKELRLYGDHYEASVTVSKHERTIFIQRLVVHSQHQRSGIARFILTDIIRQEKVNSEVDQLKISTNHSNIPVQKLLTSLNFIPCRKYLIPNREQFGDFIEFIYPLRIFK